VVEVKTNRFEESYGNEALTQLCLLESVRHQNRYLHSLDGPRKALDEAGATTLVIAPDSGTVRKG
jgi:hypothetical protein